MIDVTAEHIANTRAMLEKKLSTVIRSPNPSDEGRIAQLVADLKALDEIRPRVEPARDDGRIIPGRRSDGRYP